MDQIQKKLMTKFSDKLKKPLFLAHFPNFWDNFFKKKNQLCLAQQHIGL